MPASIAKLSLLCRKCWKVVEERMKDGSKTPDGRGVLTWHKRLRDFFEPVDGVLVKQLVVQGMMLLLMSQARAVKLHFAAIFIVQALQIVHYPATQSHSREKSKNNWSLFATTYVSIGRAIIGLTSS